MTDRDHFAAALSVVRRIDLWLEEDQADDADQTLRDARSSLIALASKLDYADAMLRRRERTTNSAESSTSLHTNHDAAPAAKAEPQSVAPQPRGHGTGDISDAAPIANCDMDAATLRSLLERMK